VNAQPATRQGAADAIAGLLASLSIFASAIGVAYRPVRLIPFAIGLALVAAAMSPNHRRMVSFAVGLGGLCFLLGMTVAVITDNPVF
jgi:hypothetical protein